MKRSFSFFANHTVFLLPPSTKTKRHPIGCSQRSFILTWVDILRSPSCRPLRVVPDILFVLESRNRKSLSGLFDFFANHTVFLLPPSTKTKRHPIGCLFVLVGEGGFEPPKSLTTDLQSAPFGHSGTLPHIKPTITVGFFGAGGRTRTPDLLITNQLLYQLSYTSAFLDA